MKFLKAFRHALKMVLHSKIRSWLTILGIVIGVAAVIAITSIGAGLKAQVSSQLNALGGDIVTVTAGGTRGFTFGPGGGGGGGDSAAATDKKVELTRLDYQALKGLSDVKLIDTNIRGSADVTYLDKQGSVSVTGVDPAVWSQLTTLTLADGRFLGPSDSNVIVIGGRLANSYFSNPLGVNQILNIEGHVYRIVGILSDESTSVYMPIESAYDILEDKERNVYDSLVIKIANEDDLNQSMLNMNEKLQIVRHVTASKPDFTISSNKERQAQRATITSSITTFLTAIAGVALLVGAVGIANTMFTSVLEKTKEIGIMKAIGARNKDILLIFMLNAALIGFIGGAIGVLIGYLLSGFMPALIGGSGIGGRFGAGTLVTPESVLLAMGISLVIGVAAGAVPAYQASRLKPVDALRYE